ncbi:MAG: dTDP-4-dehydrorhamnose 3,5-epimerase family protein [Candidatus Parcubacteria bacterium]|nr:dTDP-4-dehydrorhamnose 3,5-epimerase family protein [Candidatus Parcubacteria bacterium]
MIKDVRTKKLNVNLDDRGWLAEVLRADDDFFKEIKQVNYTETYPGVIKAFHWHKKQWDFWFVVSGSAQVALYDQRESSPTKGETNVFYLGGDNRSVLAIPPGVVHGYRVLGSQTLGLVYYTTEVYNSDNPDEQRIAFDDPKIGFDWKTKNR